MSKGNLFLRLTVLLLVFALFDRVVSPTEAAASEAKGYSCDIIASGSTAWPYGPLQILVDKSGRRHIYVVGLKPTIGKLKVGPYLVYGPHLLEDRFYGQIQGDDSSFQYICPLR